MPSGSSTLTLRTGQFPISGVSGWFLFLSYFVIISELISNSVDSDQTPRSAASDLGLYCLPMSLLWDSRLKWVKHTATVSQLHIVRRSLEANAE